MSRTAPCGCYCRPSQHWRHKGPGRPGSHHRRFLMHPACTRTAWTCQKYCSYVLPAALMYCGQQSNRCAPEPAALCFSGRANYSAQPHGDYNLQPSMGRHWESVFKIAMEQTLTAWQLYACTAGTLRTAFTLTLLNVVAGHCAKDCWYSAERHLPYRSCRPDSGGISAKKRLWKESFWQQSIPGAQPTAGSRFCRISCSP